jgi:type IV secretory pathway component VirB8
MEPGIEKRLVELERKIDEIYISVEKTRKYIFWTMIVTLVVFVLPLIALMFAIPSFLSNYTDMINTLSI